MATLFLQYPACRTCQKAKKWLTENNIEFTNRLIVEENPTVEELKAWIPRSGLLLTSMPCFASSAFST